MTESKEWVTIKIPKEIREEAREDSRTYGEIMKDGLDTPTSQGQSIPSSVENNTDGVDIAEIERKLDQIQGAQSDTVSKAMQLGELQDQQFDRIINRIDDLQAQLPKDIKSELQ